MGPRRHFRGDFVLMRWVFVAACLWASCGEPVQLDPEAAAVKAAVERCFDGMARHDSERLASSVLPEASITRLRRRDDGTVDVYSTSGSTFIEELSAPGPAYLERLVSAEVERVDDIATLRAAYTFHVDSTFSHCGMDHFTLVRGSGGWRIQSIAYTITGTDWATCKSKYNIP